MTAGNFLRLAEGDKHTFRHDFFPQAWGRSLYEKGKTGKVFVRLTNGKEYAAKYYLIPPQNFPPEVHPAQPNATR
jgi:hypothetical protein